MTPEESYSMHPLSDHPAGNSVSLSEAELTQILVQLTLFKGHLPLLSAQARTRHEQSLRLCNELLNEKNEPKAKYLDQKLSVAKELPPEMLTYVEERYFKIKENLFSASLKFVKNAAKNIAQKTIVWEKQLELYSRLPLGILGRLKIFLLSRQCDILDRTLRKQNSILVSQDRRLAMVQRRLNHTLIQCALLWKQSRWLNLIEKKSLEKWGNSTLINESQKAHLVRLQGELKQIQAKVDHMNSQVNNAQQHMKIYCSQLKNRAADASIVGQSLGYGVSGRQWQAVREVTSACFSEIVPLALREQEEKKKNIQKWRELSLQMMGFQEVLDGYWAEYNLNLELKTIGPRKDRGSHRRGVGPSS